MFFKIGVTLFLLIRDGTRSILLRKFFNFTRNKNESPVSKKKTRTSSKQKKSLPSSTKVNFWQSQSLWMPISLLLVATIVVFYPSLQNDFVNWDDNSFIYENQSIRALTLENLKIYFSDNVLGAYAPLVFFSFALEYQLFELEPFYYHLDNLLLHLGCVFLVYRICLLLELKSPAALLVAAISST